MNTIKIYLHNGKIACDLIENNINVVRHYEELQVKHVLNELIKEKNINVRIIDTINNSKAIIVRYADFLVELHNLEFLYQQENLIIEYINLIKTNLEKKQIQRVKNSNKSKKSRVERQNKYKQSIISTTSIGLIIALSITIGYLKEEKKDHDLLENDGYIVTEEENHTSHDKEQIITVPHQDLSIGPISFELNTSSDKIDVIQEIEENNIQNSSVVYIEYEDRSNTSKAKYTRETYGKIISKYANMYGLDENLMIALATQERGIHSETMDRGGATGLMQIQNSVWVGQTISGYNFETGKMDKIKITEENIGNLETNIRIGCMCFQNCLDMAHGNILIALQMYNFGYGNMSKVINAYAIETNKTRKEIYENQYDIGWLEYTDIIKAGDSNYVKNVLSWLGEFKQIEIRRKTSEERSVIVSSNPEYQNDMKVSIKNH